MSFTKRDRYTRGTTVPLCMRIRNTNGDVVRLPCPPDTIELRAPDGVISVVGPSYYTSTDRDGPHYRFDLQTGREAEINYHLPGNWEATWIVRYAFRGGVYALRKTYFFELTNDQ